jgi:hypothetical protein
VNDIFPGSEITVDPATINLSAAALKMGNTREQLNMNDIQPENTSFPYSQSGDDISIMTPSTISSDDADLDFSSDEEGSERGHELDFSRLTAPPRKKERKSLLAENKNNEIATEQIIDDLDHSNKLERAFGSRDHQVNGSDACVAISPSQSVGDNSTSSEEVVMYQVDTIDDDDSTVTNDEDNDDEDADDDDDDDDESIEWAPTPVKACGEPNDYFAESLTSQASSVNTFGNLMEKFNHIEDRSPPKVRMKDDYIVDQISRNQENFCGDSSDSGSSRSQHRLPEETHLSLSDYLSSRSPSYDPKQFENNKQQFYKEIRNSASPRNSPHPQAFSTNLMSDHSVDSSTTYCMDSDRNNYADTEKGAYSTRKPPPPSTSPPLGSHENQESLRNALSSIISAQDSDDEKETSDLVDQLSKYDKEEEAEEEDNRHSSNGHHSSGDVSSDEGSLQYYEDDCDNQLCNGVPSPMPPHLHQQQSPLHQPLARSAKTHSPTARESLFMLEELNSLDSSFGRVAPRAIPSPPPPLHHVVNSKPRGVEKDTFPVVTSGPGRKDIHDITVPVPHLTGRVKCEPTHEEKQVGVGLSGSDSVCSDRELSRLMKTLPKENSPLKQKEAEYSCLDEEDPFEDEAVEEPCDTSRRPVKFEKQDYWPLQQEGQHRDTGTSPLFEVVLGPPLPEPEPEPPLPAPEDDEDYDESEDDSALERSMFAESSSMDLFNDSLSRQQSLQSLRTRVSLSPQAEEREIVMSPPAYKAAEHRTTSLGKNDQKRSVTDRALAQKARRDAITAFRLSDVDNKGALGFDEFARFLEFSGFYPRSDIMPALDSKSPLIVDDQSHFRRGQKPRIQKTAPGTSPSATTRCEQQKQLDIKKKAFLLAFTFGSFGYHLAPGQPLITELAFKDLMFQEEVETISLDDAIKFLEAISGNKLFKDKTINRVMTELRNNRKMYARRINSRAASTATTASAVLQSPPTRTEQTLAKVDQSTPLPPNSAKSITTCSTFFSERGAAYGLSSDEAREVYRERRWNKVLQETTNAKEKELTFQPKLNTKSRPRPPPPPLPSGVFSSPEFMISELDSSMAPPDMLLCRDQSNSKSLAYTNINNFDKENIKKSKKMSSEDIELEEHCRFAPVINGVSPFVSERELASITQRANASAPPPPPPPRSGIVNCGQSLQQAKENEIMTIPLDPDLNIYYYNARACPPVALPVVIPDAPALPGSAWLAFTEKDVQKKKVNFVIKKKSAAEKEALANAKPAFGSLLEELNFKLKGIGTPDSLIKLKSAPVTHRLNMGAKKGKKKKRKEEEGFENLMDEMKFMLARLNKFKVEGGGVSDEE